MSAMWFMHKCQYTVLFAAADEARKNYNDVDARMRKIEDEIR